MFFHTKSVSPYLYIHYPICQHHCSYCDFNVYTKGQLNLAPDGVDGEWVEACLRHLKNHIHFEGLPRAFLQTLYLGGGSPSLIGEKSLIQLKEGLFKLFDFSEIKEVTLEANPEHVSEEKINLWKTIGVERLSMGVQSFQPEILKKLERLSTIKNLEAALSAVQKHFKNYSLDLMFGVPGQTLEHLKMDLEKCSQWDPPHVSIYALTLGEDHKLLKYSKWTDQCPPEETTEAMYLLICDWMKDHGYEHYEISNFAKPGFRSIHNQNYWNPQSDYLALGPGAHGYLHAHKTVRYGMIKDPKAWAKDDNGVDWVEELTEEQKELESRYLKLRTGQYIPCKRDGLLERWQKDGLVEFCLDEVKITERGWIRMESLSAHIVAAVR